LYGDNSTSNSTLTVQVSWNPTFFARKIQ